MNVLRKLSSMSVVAVILLALGSGCSPQKTVTKYSYLLKDDSKSVDNKSVKNDPIAKVEKKKTSGKNAKGDVRQVLSEASSYMGVPYKYGGVNKGGIDCSALTQNAWASVGKKIPRSSKEQARVGDRIAQNKIAPGDLVFFSAKSTGRVDHVGMVTTSQAGEVIFIHATTSKGVREDRLDTGYWKPRFLYARRMN